MGSLVVSKLTYGGVLFACLGNVEMTMTPSSTVFTQAERLVRDMLRWALRAPVDTRASMMYLMGHTPTL